MIYNLDKIIAMNFGGTKVNLPKLAVVESKESKSDLELVAFSVLIRFASKNGIIKVDNIQNVIDLCKCSKKKAIVLIENAKKSKLFRYKANGSLCCNSYKKLYASTFTDKKGVEHEQAYIFSLDRKRYNLSLFQLVQQLRCLLFQNAVNARKTMLERNAQTKLTTKSNNRLLTSGNLAGIIGVSARTVRRMAKRMAIAGTMIVVPAVFAFKAADKIENRECLNFTWTAKDNKEVGYTYYPAQYSIATIDIKRQFRNKIYRAFDKGAMCQNSKVSRQFNNDNDNQSMFADGINYGGCLAMFD